MTARYRLLEKTFIAPYTLQAGSIIETNAPASGHMEPLNAEAEESLEAWYKKKVDVTDENGKVVRTVFPNANKRPLTETQAVEQRTEVKLVTAPPKEDYTGMSLAEALNTRGTPADTDAQGQLLPLVESEPAPEPMTSVDGGTVVLEAAPTPKKG